jgi:hypothetical protein
MLRFLHLTPPEVHGLNCPHCRKGLGDFGPLYASHMSSCSHSHTKEHDEVGQTLRGIFESQPGVAGVRVEPNGIFGITKRSGYKKRPDFAFGPLNVAPPGNTKIIVVDQTLVDPLCATAIRLAATEDGAKPGASALRARNKKLKECSDGELDETLYDFVAFVMETHGYLDGYALARLRQWAQYSALDRIARSDGVNAEERCSQLAAQLLTIWQRALSVSLARTTVRKIRRGLQDANVLGSFGMLTMGRGMGMYTDEALSRPSVRRQLLSAADVV